MAWAGMTIDPTKLAQLAWALAHFLWQGAAVALVLALAAALNIRRHISFLECRMFDVPWTTGWLRPLVLLPATALTSLRADQVKAVVVHELAHVRRHDYLVNLVQSVIEGLFFFHPA